MQVKTFEASSMKDAVKAVKAEFGQNAVILKTKEKFFENTKMYEVTAAVPDRSKNFGASSQDDHQAEFGELDQRVEGLESKFKSFNDLVARKTQLANIESSLEELKILVMEALRQKDGSLLKDLTPPLADLSKQLQLTGVDEALTAQLIKYLQDLPDDTTAQKSASPVEYYRSQSIRWMLKRITIAPKAQATKGNLMISAFVGPSGCGKTSVVAKLASQFSRQQKAKVLIVSLDHQRVGGSEQLRIFAKILGCEFEVIENASELEKAIQSHRDAEVVLIDTAGRSPKNQQKMGDLTDLAKLPIPVEFHLVLSCSERPAHLDRCVRSFSGLSISSLCFTKLDETWSYGDIFNLSTRWSLPLSYFSVGPKIPDDLERATKERVVERIFSL